MSLSRHAVVERPGPLCTIQDLGRRTGRRMGLAPGGAMDQRACLWANRLLGNDPTDAGLEITLGGFSIRFEAETIVALTGADFGASLDGVATGRWRTVRAGPGQTLSLDFGQEGVRAYLAFPGGLDVPRMFGSASAVLREGLPGLLGRPVEAGEALRWLDPDRAIPVRRVPSDQIPTLAETLELPFLPAYEWEDFSVEDRARLLEGEWTIDAASDRTACRLSGGRLSSGPVELDSVPLVDGTVQVPGDGVPLVFMRDRPTIGGYPKLGSVDPIALDSLAQARPGQRVRFIRADPERLRDRMVLRERFFGLG